MRKRPVAFTPAAAKRVAATVAAHENRRRNISGRGFAAIADDPLPILRGTFSGVWTKSGTATVDVGGEEYSAKNYFSTVGSAGETKTCALANVGDEWILIAAECP